jgi:uncharacterized protein YjbI with pentapeptide repeats
MNIQQVIIDHGLWLKNEGGARADLSDADLIYADLSDADLSYANLRRANLRRANLRRANLRGANLRGADLNCADLSDADLSDADLSDADLSCANLRGANLRGADLSHANLRDANLRNCIGNMEQIKSLQCDTWLISYTSTHLNIGCQTHTIEDWFDFSNDEISSMDNEALVWWKVWKPILKNIIDVSPGI